MGIEHVIVQAGGKGTRMGRLTQNKPKALVPVNNLPMIFHLFKKFPRKKFIVIGDYKFDALKKYLAAFARVDYKIVDGRGRAGTCGGLSEALSFVPEDAPFMLIWCDLILPDEYELPEEPGNYIGISKDFPCRWMYKDGKFTEERSGEFGVAGHFVFANKSVISDVPPEGEFVRYLSGKGIQFKEQSLYKTHEYGLYSEWSKLEVSKCRPFNSMKIDGNKIHKIPVDAQGESLAKREIAWYKKIAGKNFENIPKIYEYEPLCMEKVDGKNIYEYTEILFERKKEILRQIVGCLKSVHGLERIPADKASFDDAYIGKTFARLEKVKELIPFAKEEFVVVNEKKCRNVFFYKEALEKMVAGFMPKEFCLIHGDCTFSNTMLRNDGTPVLIDPRGYFGKTEFYGDAAYDWVKLYYSLVSNYDQFNLKRFELAINESDVQLKIESNKWEELEDCFFELLGDEVTRQQMKILLAITWLSLTTYAWHDYDSICGAFYNGLLYFEEAMENAQVF